MLRKCFAGFFLCEMSCVCVSIVKFPRLALLEGILPMLFIFFRLIFLSFLLFFCSFKSYSGCLSCSDSVAIDELLIDLKLNPEMRNNSELIDALRFEYGEHVVRDLFNRHPYLKVTDGKINHKTLLWIRDKYFIDRFGLGIEYILLPFVSADIDFASEIFVNVIVGWSNPMLTRIPLFISKEQYKSVKRKFKENNYKYPIEYLSLHFGLTHDDALLESKKLYDKIFHGLNYISSSDVHLIGENRKIIVVGHSVPSADFIECGSHQVKTIDIVNLLKNMGLSNEIDIELEVCYGANGYVNLFTRQTESALVDMFKMKKLSSIAGRPKQSFLYKFAKEMYEHWPDFNGEISSYYGLMKIAPNEAYQRDLLDENKIIKKKIFSSSFLSAEDRWVAFDKNELRVTYKKEDFIFN